MMNTAKAVVACVVLLVGGNSEQKAKEGGASVRETTAPEKKVGAAAYDDFKEPYRTQFLKGWESAIEQQRLAVVRAKGPKAKREARARLAELRANDPPYIPVGAMPSPVRVVSRSREVVSGGQVRTFGRDIEELSWKVGDFGSMKYNSRIVQRLSDGRILAWVHSNEWLVMFTGFKTDAVDGGELRLDVPVHVTGTTTYETVLGGTKTVLLVEPLNLDSLKRTPVDKGVAESPATTAPK